MAENAAIRMADAVASASILSPKQLKEVEKKKSNYFSLKPDMSSEDVQLYTQKKLGVAGVEVYQAYLEQLKDAYLPVAEGLDSFDSKNRIRRFDVVKWVSDSEEKNLDKLVNVYQVLSEEDCNIALIYDRKVEGCHISLGVVNTDEYQSDPTKAEIYITRLLSAIYGNFPGVEIKKDESGYPCIYSGIPSCLNCNSSYKDNTKSIAIVSNLASEKSDSFISQSMEKLLDGIVPHSVEEEYTIVLLAKPIIDQLSKKNKLFKLYTDLAPYAKWQTNHTFSLSDISGSSTSLTMNVGLSAGIQGSSTSSSGFGYHIGANFGAGFSRSSNVSVQVGENDGLSQNYTNYGVQHTLDIIEKQINRLEECSALGMWEFAAYFISESPVVANNVAHMYLALTQGEESFITKATVNLFDGC